MSLNLKRLIVMISVVAMLVGGVSAQAANDQWTCNKKNTSIYWVSTADSRSDDTALQEQVQLFAKELSVKNILDNPSINFGPLQQAGNMDIILYLDSTRTDIPAQGYEITISKSLKISASDKDGLFYGCRYVLQHLITSDGLLNDSTIKHSPDVLERGVSLDCGRKYYTKDWIINLIREMSWYNMNALTLHFSEDMGIRLEHPNKEYSWLMGSNNDLCPKNGTAETYIKNNKLYENEVYDCKDSDQGKYLKIADLEEIVAAAKLYHVEIIPSFDSPGHMTFAIEQYKKQYDGTDLGAYITQADGTTVPTDNKPVGTSYSIDLSNHKAIAFAQDVIKGYAQLFYDLGCRKFDMGGDELLGGNSRWKQLPTWTTYARQKTGNTNATAYDAFILYMNDLTKMLVDDMGYESVRMWNDMLYLSSVDQTVELDKRIQVNFWQAKGFDVNTYLNNGHDVYNYYNDYNYFVVKGNSFYPLANFNEIYEHFTPFVFKATTQPVTTDVNNPYDSLDALVWKSNDVVITNETDKAKVKGSAFCIWSDVPDFYTEQEVIDLALNSIRAHAVKAWGVDTINVTNFVNNLSTLGYCPGKSGNYGSAPLPSAQTVNKKVDMDKLYEVVDETVSTVGCTTNSVSVYNAAKADAIALMSASNATQAQIDAAVAAMNTAKNNLAQKGDTSTLETAVAEFDALDANLYTDASYKAYETAVNKGKALIADKENLTQAQIDTAVAEIAAAKDGLEVDTTKQVIAGSGFVTKRVRIGGNAVIRLHLRENATNYVVKDRAGNLIECKMVQYAEQEADGTYMCYLAFELPAGETGSRTYTVELDGTSVAQYTVIAWRAAR